MKPISFTLNGKRVEAKSVSPNTTLLDYLRRDLAETGTKEGCAEGDCGACTVAIVDEAPGGERSYRAVNSCLTLLPMVHGATVVSVEGLRDADGYHPAQSELAERLGSQCGYCTPGVVMSLFEACYRDDLDQAWKIDDQMCGNLCRCTGYRPIREAAEAVAGQRPSDRFAASLQAPAEQDRGLVYQAGDERFLQPTSWEQLFDACDAHPDHRFVSGATDLGLDVTKQGVRFSSLISTSALPGMRGFEADEGRIVMGAGVSLADVERLCEEALPPLTRILRFFGSRQIKNRATLGGNLCNASPIGDSAPVLMALGASVVLKSRAGERTVLLDDFFTGYRETVLRPGEVLCRVECESIGSDVLTGAYKVSKRREMDISAVAAGMMVLLDGEQVVEARLAYGGMAATTMRASGAEAALVGQRWCEASVARAMEALGRDFTPIDDHRSSAWYRERLARNFLKGFFLETQAARFQPLGDRPSSTIVLEGGQR